MEVQIRKLQGSWDIGFAMHKHTLSSVYTGDNAYGHASFDTTRSGPGEALFQLKYRHDWSQVGPLAAQVKTSLWPLFPSVGLIVPMPASTSRSRQPVDELAKELGNLTKTPVFDNLVVRGPLAHGSTPLKNLHGREEKEDALAGLFTINRDSIGNEGSWNALLLDDLFDTGATMEAVCKALKAYKKINRVYAAAITWK